MVEKDEEWLLPENLKKQEQRVREEAEAGRFDAGGGDFASHYAYRKGISYDLIKPHAESNDASALTYAKTLKHVLRSNGFDLRGTIIDIGCAIGTFTNAMHKLNPDGRTMGLDIGQDAIEVAKEKYSNCIFYCQSADNLDNFNDNYFDVIHAREFYPFTRTNDSDYQLKYLDLFCRKLKSGGLVILAMVALDRGFCNTFRKQHNQLQGIGYHSVRRKTRVPRPVAKYVGNLLSNKLLYVLSSLMGNMLLLILGGQVEYFYILQKR